MKRRQFSLSLLGAPAVWGVSVGIARAQGAPVEGVNYVKLSQPVATASDGKIEVIEFFWYGCPHCNALEPALDAWQKALPADVAFRRVPVAFREGYVVHQRIFYALDTMGLVPAMHRKVFYAIHVDRMRLDKLPDIVVFMTANGVDGAKFSAAFDSFTVQTKARQAAQLSAAYKIDGVPAFGVQGRYYTSGSLAGGNERALTVAQYLVQRARQGN